MGVASKEHVNRCGDSLRRWWDGDEPDPESLDAWLAAVWSFREGHQYPMRKTAVGLRQFVQREASSVLVAQRLKRLPQIVHKLSRMPRTKLARMEDIGGCRAVLTNRAEIDGVLDRIRRNWDVKRERDYIEAPKASGYRGMHVVVERDDHRIEIQLRTFGQQAWASTVEKLAGQYRIPLKDERGPAEVLEWLKFASDGIARDELGLQVDPDFDARFVVARDRALKWMREAVT